MTQSDILNSYAPALGMSSTEHAALNVRDRIVLLNGLNFKVRTDFQTDNRSHFCKNLDISSGRCLIYERRPFTCDFELIRFIVPRCGPIHLTQKLFNRGWAMKRVDGRRGARCAMTASSEFSKAELLRKVERLAVWSDYFRITTCVPEVIGWIRMGPHSDPLLVPV